MSLLESPVVLLLLRLLAAGAFVLAIYFLTKYISRILDRVAGSMDRRVRKEIEDVIRYIIYLVAALIAIAIISPEASILTTLLLLVGLALIIAFSDSLRNWGAQYAVRGTGLIKLGDWIEVDGQYGRVIEEKESGIVLESAKRERIFIPNTKLASSIIVNRTTHIGSIHIISFLLPQSRNPVEVIDRLREIASLVRPELASDPEILMRAGKNEYAFDVVLELVNASKLPLIQEEIVRKVLEIYPEARTTIPSQ
ncbi:MAG: mechanosensitive ion channel family protein [Fervidicoccaceae archaeon]